MIALQRLNGQAFILNAGLIETIESTPDTIIKLSGGKTIVVRNGIEDIVKKIIKYKQLCSQSIQVVHRSENETANDIID